MAAYFGAKPDARFGYTPPPGDVGFQSRGADFPPVPQQTIPGSMAGMGGGLPDLATLAAQSQQQAQPNPLQAIWQRFFGGR